MAEEHNRRKGYRQYCGDARKTERDFVRHMMLFLVRMHPLLVKEKPREYAGAKRGPEPRHSQDKLSFLCMLKVAWNKSFEDVIEDIGQMSGEWKDEPRPDVSWVKKHMKKIDIDVLDKMLVFSAKLCLDELRVDDDVDGPKIIKVATVKHEIERTAGVSRSNPGPKAPLAMDNTAVEIDRYEDMQMSRSFGRETIQTRVKKPIKWHTQAITGHRIIISAMSTDSSVSDMSTVPELITHAKTNYSELLKIHVNCDKGYDSDENVRVIQEAGFIPNIKQRDTKTDASRTNLNKPYRKKAAENFDDVMYPQRGLIEGMYGAEETKNHQMYCRMRLEGNRKRFGKLEAIAFNIKVLNRFICAHLRGYRIPSYGYEEEQLILSHAHCYMSIHIIYTWYAF